MVLSEEADEKEQSHQDNKTKMFTCSGWRLDYSGFYRRTWLLEARCPYGTFVVNLELLDLVQSRYFDVTETRDVGHPAPGRSVLAFSANVLSWPCHHAKVISLNCFSGVSCCRPGGY